ncbi:MAG: glycosyltransferase [Thermodesulfobacteriota bacterium]|nr:glycosyltransferase [Thermodesulfobacteriota bacterium]
MSRKVLIVNLEFPPIGGPGVQRVLKFVRYLPREDWMPTVICGDKATWHTWRDHSLLEEIPDGVDVFRISFAGIEDCSAFATAMAEAVLCPLRLFFSKEKIREELRDTLHPLLSYAHPQPLVMWVYHAAKRALQCHELKEFDAVLTSGPPHITHMVGLALKGLCQVKWIADFRDPWIDNRLYADSLGLSQRLDRMWERLVLRKADCIVAVSQNWARLLAKKLSHSDKSRVHVVYNGYDPDDIPEPEDGEPSSNELRIHYNGSIQGPMLPVLFFKALAQLKEQESAVYRDLVCTFTGLPVDVAKLAASLQLNGIVKDVGRLSHAESVRAVMASDVLLLILNNVDETCEGQITGKVYEYLAAGKHILAIIPSAGDLYALLKNHERCSVVSWDDLEGIVTTLKFLITKKGRGQLGWSSPPNWIDHYTREAQTARLARILQSLVQGVP